MLLPPAHRCSVHAFVRPEGTRTRADTTTSYGRRNRRIRQRNFGREDHRCPRLHDAPSFPSLIDDVNGRDCGLPEPGGSQNWPPRNLKYLSPGGVGVSLPRICEPPPVPPLTENRSWGSSRSGYNRTFFTQRKFPLTGGKPTHPSSAPVEGPVFLQRNGFSSRGDCCGSSARCGKRSGAIRSKRENCGFSRAFLPAGGGATWHRTGGRLRGRREGRVGLDGVHR